MRKFTFILIQNLISSIRTYFYFVPASLDFKKNQKKKMDERGREFRTNYFNSRQKAAVYPIIVNDPEIVRTLKPLIIANFA